MGVIAEALQHWKNDGKSVAGKKSCPGRWINRLKSITVPVCAGLDYFIIPAPCPVVFIYSVKPQTFLSCRLGSECKYGVFLISCLSSCGIFH